MMRKLPRAGLWLLAVATPIAAAGWVALATLSDLPDVSSLQAYRPPVVTTVWSRDGALMAELFEERRRVVDVASLPPHVTRAFLAAEDSQFFRHQGLDWRGILRAAWANLREQRVAQGGSTITQQVVKSLLLSPERSFRRKLREAVLAIRIEQNLSKDEILHLYLNQIYLGHGAYGVEAAAETYFGTSSQKLSLAQAALLAGLPQAPSRYDPYQQPERALERRRYVLTRIAEEGWANKEDVQRAGEEPLGLVGYQNRFASVSPYFSEHVRRVLEGRYGRETLLKEGLRIVTTMDARLQAAAQQALRKGLEELDRSSGYRGALDRVDPSTPGAFAQGDAPVVGQRARALVVAVDAAGAWVLTGGQRVRLPSQGMAWAVGSGGRPDRVLSPGDVVLCDFVETPGGLLTARLAQEPQVEGALVCLDPRTGEVLAAVGGYDFGRSQFNRTVQALRQPGSALKPMIFAAALDRGYTPATLVYDTAIVYDSEDPEEETWKPKNYSAQFYGATTLRDALVHSRNIVTVKVLREVGISPALHLLRELGITSPMSPDLSLALGASAVTPLELVSAYGVFATGGLRSSPAFLLRVEDRDGALLEVFTPPEPQRVLRADIAYVLTHMMQGVISEGTARQAAGLGHPAAGKTGTTNDNRDAWFVGYTPDLVAGVWIGHDSGRSLGKGETGGRVAAPVWLDFMTEAVRGRPASEFPIPEGVEFARIDASGRLARTLGAGSAPVAFLRGTAPAYTASSGGGEEEPAASPAFDPRDPGNLDALR